MNGQSCGERLGWLVSLPALCNPGPQLTGLAFLAQIFAQQVDPTVLQPRTVGLFLWVLLL